ncbi:MAG TPA: glycosyltransferase family 1 protein [Acidimicrobiales bacterium]|nr:glycosyltransferase family 1 protein [Acidimicrobiales bacterium]
MSELRVSLDVTAVPGQPAGAGRYTLDLAQALAGRSDVALTLICRRADAERWRSLGDSVAVLPASPAPRPLRLAWEQVRLPRLLRSLPIDVHHSPHYTMPEAAGAPRVVTIHDLTFFDHPEWHERAKAAFFRRAIRVAARNADVVVCVSEYTARRLADLHRPAGEVRVVRHGVDHTCFRPEEPGAGADLAVLGQLGIGRPYVAFVGTLEPRKDVPTLVQAFDRVAAARPDLRLVVAGARGWGAAAVDEAVAAARHRDRVVRLGYVAGGALPALLRQASAVVYPSLEEGFGLPALEALACGAPLVTTSGSAMEEVATGAALLVAPGDAEAMAAAVDSIVRGDAGLHSRRERGLAVAAAHTWASSAEGHVAAYASALSRRRGRL